MVLTQTTYCIFLLIPIIEKEVDGGGGEWRKQKVRRGSGKRRGGERGGKSYSTTQTE